jgi:hypothetical protein
MIASEERQKLKKITTGAASIEDQAQGHAQLGVIQAAAPSFGVEVRPDGVLDADEIGRAVTAFARSQSGGLIVTGSALANIHRNLIVTLAARHRLPTVFRALLRHRRRLDLLRA